MEKEQVKKFDLEAAFKALDEIETMVTEYMMEEKKKYPGKEKEKKF